jgi:multiple sugar transport system ATP-binding protein
MRAQVARIQRRFNTTTVYVTHDQTEAMTLGDRVAVMLSGVLQQVGSPMELYNDPSNLFVAGFIGSPAMNFLKGKIEGGAFRAEGGFALPLPGNGNGAEGKPVVYGVRPEHFQLSAQGLPATVHVIEPTGSETQVMAEFAGAPVVCAFRERVSAKPGETIRITPDSSLVHVFDASSGQRMSA